MPWHTPTLTHEDSQTHTHTHNIFKALTSNDGAELAYKQASRFPETLAAPQPIRYLEQAHAAEADSIFSADYYIYKCHAVPVEQKYKPWVQETCTFFKIIY